MTAASIVERPEDPKPAESEPVIGGMRGLLYVAVQSALNEGFTEEEVFTHEKLSPEAWQRADEAWAAALADSVETDSKLFDSYDATYNAYKWAFHRVIEPLESDVDAWLFFSTRLAEAEDQDAVLEPHGIDHNDVLRLQELWSARLAQDAALRERMLEGPKLSELPPLQVPPKVLPPAVNQEPLTAPAEDESAPETEAPKPPPPPLFAALPVFARAPGAPVAPPSGPAPPSGAPVASPAVPTSVSGAPSAPASSVPASPPPEEFGFYVPPPERVTPLRPAAAPPLQPMAAPPPVVHDVAPPPLVTPAGQARPPDWQRLPPPQLSISDYTSAIAEIQAFPGSEARVASKYGMSAEAFAKERVAWDNQLAQMPNLRPDYADRLGRAVAHWQALARRR